MAREGLPEKGASEKNPKGNERGNDVDIWGKSIPEGIACAKALRQKNMPGELEENQKPAWLE